LKRIAIFGGGQERLCGAVAGVQLEENAMNKVLSGHSFLRNFKSMIDFFGLAY
jgi:hypothetical protein